MRRLAAEVRSLASNRQITVLNGGDGYGISTLFYLFWGDSKFFFFHHKFSCEVKELLTNEDFFFLWVRQLNITCSSSCCSGGIGLWLYVVEGNWIS